MKKQSKKQKTVRRVKEIALICTECEAYIESSPQMLIKYSRFMLFQGLICNECGNVIILDEYSLQSIANYNEGVGAYKAPVKRAPLHWKIIQKAKVGENAPRARRSAAHRKT